jgi:hypothetical protein
MASIMRFDTLQNTAGVNALTIGATGQVYIPGSVVQVQYSRTDVRSTWSSSTSGNGLTISDLAITITPKFSNSRLIMQWMINGELHQDNVFLIHKNASLITTAGETGYNSSIGNIRSSGYASGFYDQNEDSTPSNWFLQYSAISGSTTAMTFAPAIRSSSGSGFTLALNRTLSGSTGDAHESMVSSGLIMEVAQ